MIIFLLWQLGAAAENLSYWGLELAGSINYVLQVNYETEAIFSSMLTFQAREQPIADY